MKTLSKEQIYQAAVTQFQTPFSYTTYAKTDSSQKITDIAHHVKSIMEVLGLDLSNASLRDTPERVASMIVQELCAGLDLAQFPEIALFDHDRTERPDNMIVTKVRFSSICEHHLVPMIGVIHIGYIPREHIIGLSKLARITQYFAARPQLQERLSFQIADCLATLLGHNDIAILLEAKHGCIAFRGVQDETSTTSTLRVTGIFEQSDVLRSTFLELTRSSA